MTLSISLNGQPITSRTSRLQIKSTINGFAAVTFDLNRKLDQALLPAFTDVRVYDPQTGEQVGGGRFLEQGRNDDGTWQVTCIGEGMASMQDRKTPWFAIDSSLDSWRMHSRNTRRWEASKGVPPDSIASVDGLLAQATPDGESILVGQGIRMVNDIAELCDQGVASVLFYQQGAIASPAGWRIMVIAADAGGGGEVAASIQTWSSAFTGPYSTDFASGLPVGKSRIYLGWDRTSAPRVIDENTFHAVYSPIIRAQLYDQTGALQTSPSSFDKTYVTINDCFTDWVCRYAPRLDITTARIDDGTHQFKQLAYPDGIDGVQLLDDLCSIERDFVWAVWEKLPTGKWATELKRLPTTVRYQASVGDGFSAPSPSTELYNRATVTGQNEAGVQVNYTRTSVVPELDAVGLVREDTMRLGSGAWSADAADAATEAFLANHRVAPNAGTLRIARPIFDSSSGRWVRPAHIRPGELIRVHGIQPIPDSLNATSPDGVTLFRIVAMTYDDETGIAVLELDSLQLTQARAIATLWQSMGGFYKAVKNQKWAAKTSSR